MPISDSPQFEKFKNLAEMRGLHTLEGAYGQCGVASCHFHNRIGGNVLEFSNPVNTRNADSRYRHTLPEEISHRVNLVDGHVVDWTGVQLNEDEKNFPIIEPLSEYKKRFNAEPVDVTETVGKHKAGAYRKNAEELEGDDFLGW